MHVSYRVHHHNKRLGNLFGETYIRGFDSNSLCVFHIGFTITIKDLVIYLVRLILEVLTVIHYACFI